MRGACQRGSAALALLICCCVWTRAAHHLDMYPYTHRQAHVCGNKYLNTQALILFSKKAALEVRTL